jgi:hypothetical protein
MAKNRMNTKILPKTNGLEFSHLIAYGSGGIPTMR